MPATAAPFLVSRSSPYSTTKQVDDAKGAAVASAIMMSAIAVSYDDQICPHLEAVDQV
jgi:hypothetical protein